MNVYNGFRGICALMDDLVLFDQAGFIARTMPSESDLEQLNPESAKRITLLFQTSLPTRLGEAVAQLHKVAMEAALYLHVMLRVYDNALTSSNADEPLPVLCSAYRLHPSCMGLLDRRTGTPPRCDEEFMARLVSRVCALADEHPVSCKWKMCPGCALMGLHCACDDVEEPDEEFAKHAEYFCALRKRAVSVAKALAGFVGIFALATAPSDEYERCLADTLHRHGDHKLSWFICCYAAVHVARVTHLNHALETIATLSPEKCHVLADLVDAIGTARATMKSVMTQTTGDAFAALAGARDNIGPETSNEAIVALFQRVLGRSAGRMAVA